MNYSAALNALRDRGRLIGATLRFNLARGLPMLSDPQPCFHQLREWLHGRGDDCGVGQAIRNWEGVDQLANLVGSLQRGRQPDPVALADPVFTDRCPAFWRSLQVVPAGQSLSLILTVSEADAADELPADIVTAGLLLYALAAVTGRAAGELVVHVGVLTLGESAPVESRDVLPLAVLPPCGGLEGLLSLEWGHVSVGQAVA